MDVCRIIISVFSIILLSQFSAATELSRCLTLAKEHQHRLEKEDSILNCFEKNKQQITRDTCYKSLTKNVIKSVSSKINEQLHSICFYETTYAKNIDTCTQDTEKFKNTLNHDEALFYCYQQFQEKIIKKDCFKIANLLIYPLKKEYLKQYCERDGNNND